MRLKSQASAIQFTYLASEDLHRLNGPFLRHSATQKSVKMLENIFKMLSSSIGSFRTQGNRQQLGSKVTEQMKHSRCCQPEAEKAREGRTRASARGSGGKIQKFVICECNRTQSTLRCTKSLALARRS